jgi:hypothetical protein
MKALLALCLAAAASGVAAQGRPVDRALAAGQIGERYDGYLGVAATIPSSLRNQVAAINIRRRRLYSDLAAQKRVAPQEVGITAGCRLLQNTGVGEVYFLPDGKWHRRAPGRQVQLPDYCR